MLLKLIRLFPLLLLAVHSFGQIDENQQYKERCLPYDEYRSDTLERVGDSLFAAEQFSSARNHYLESLIFCPSYQSSKMLVQSQNAIDKDSSTFQIEDVVYAKLVARADFFLENNAYPQAEILYEKAKYFRPKEEHPAEMLDKIEDVLKE